jgi:hypothetical protein
VIRKKHRATRGNDPFRLSSRRREYGRLDRRLTLIEEAIKDACLSEWASQRNKRPIDKTVRLCIKQGGVPLAIDGYVYAAECLAVWSSWLLGLEKGKPWAK